MDNPWKCEMVSILEWSQGYIMSPDAMNTCTIAHLTGHAYYIFEIGTDVNASFRSDMYMYVLLRHSHIDSGFKYVHYHIYLLRRKHLKPQVITKHDCKEDRGRPKAEEIHFLRQSF